MESAHKAGFYAKPRYCPVGLTSHDKDGSEYSADEVAFLIAMDRYKRRLKRYPTCAETLVLAKSLGWQKP